MLRAPIAQAEILKIIERQFLRYHQSWNLRIYLSTILSGDRYLKYELYIYDATISPSSVYRLLMISQAIIDDLITFALKLYNLLKLVIQFFSFKLRETSLLQLHGSASFKNYSTSLLSVSKKLPDLMLKLYSCMLIVNWSISDCISFLNTSMSSTTSI